MNNSTKTVKKINVGIGSVYVEQEETELIAYAIGSCIALCLYEPQAQIGAMAHILLPSVSYTGHENVNIDLNTKYANYALSEALERMNALGADKAKIRAAIIGGAQMFPHGSIQALNIGEMNIASVSLELQKEEIPILYSETGGEKSRTVSFRIPGSGFAEQIIIKNPFFNHS